MAHLDTSKESGSSGCKIKGMHEEAKHRFSRAAQTSIKAKIKRCRAGSGHRTFTKMELAFLFVCFAESAAQGSSAAAARGSLYGEVSSPKHISRSLGLGRFLLHAPSLTRRLWLPSQPELLSKIR